MICEIRHLAVTVSDVCLKLGCFQSTSTYSALEVSHFNSRLTYLLTYWEYNWQTVVGCWPGSCYEALVVGLSTPLSRATLAGDTRLLLGYRDNPPLSHQGIPWAGLDESVPRPVRRHTSTAGCWGETPGSRQRRSLWERDGVTASHP